MLFVRIVAVDIWFEAGWVGGVVSTMMSREVDNAIVCARGWVHNEMWYARCGG